MNKTIIVEDGLSINLNRGVGQYTLSIIKMLKSLGYDVQVPRKTFLDNINITFLRRILYILWLNTFFIISLLFKRKTCIVIFPATITPFLKPFNVTYIAVMHDILHLVYPNTRTKIQRLHDHFAFFTAANFADRIITVSQTTKNELEKRNIIKNKQIDVIYNTHSVSLVESTKETTEILQELNIIKQKYILSVATVHRHKNIQTLINAFSKISQDYPDIKLVLVGNKGNCTLNINNKNIILSGFVSNDNLKVLYQNALFYVFPSLYEGFGIPLIDAQYFGLPVVCSDIPIFREICGDSALYCTPTEEGIIVGLKSLLDSKNLYNDLQSRGIHNTKRYEISEIMKKMEVCLDEINL